MTRRTRLTVLTLVVATNVCWAGSEVSRLEPSEPRWGGTLQIAYDTAAPKAKFHRGDQVHAVLWLFYPNRVVTRAIALEEAATVLKAQISIEDGLGYANVFFVTPWGWDTNGDIGTKVYRPDGQPARGAVQHGIGPDDDPSDYEKEIRRYPENYWAYRDRWRQLSSVKPTGWQATVADELVKIRRHEATAPPDYFYAVSFGELLLGKEDESRRSLRFLAEHFPTSAFLARAVLDYEYQVYVKKLARPAVDEVHDLARDVAIKNPASPLAREKFRSFAGEVGFPVSALESIYQAWVAEEADNPGPYLGMAEALHLRKTTPMRTLEILDRGIDLSLQGRRRFYDDIGGKQTTDDLASAFTLRGELDVEAGNNARALADFEAAKSLLTDSDGNPYMLEGRLWRDLGQGPRAEAEFREAWRRAAPGAEAELRALYRHRNGDEQGFEAFLHSAGDQVETRGATKPAPDFHVTSLDGQPFDSKSLRGKVVVLNFWFTGCGPCVVEIPALNRLVAKFQGQPVVFIAMSLDSPKILKKFLLEQPFHYTIIPDSGPVHSQFEVGAYPSHVVIGEDGNIANVFRGATPDIDETLGAITTRLLTERR